MNNNAKLGADAEPVASDERRKWMLQLARLSYPTDVAWATSHYLGYLPLLGSLPDLAFTTASLEHVCCAPRKLAIHSFDEVKKPLTSWWHDNRPYQVRMASPLPMSRPAPTEAEKIAASVAAALACAVLADSRAQRVVAPRPPPRASYGTDEQLLAKYEAAGHHHAASAYRAETLRRKIAGKHG